MYLVFVLFWVFLPLRFIYDDGDMILMMIIMMVTAKVTQ